MSDDTIELIIEEDPEYGPLMQHMLNYNEAEFEQYVINENSDGTRRAIVDEKAKIQAELVKLTGGWNKVDFSTKDLRPALIRQRNMRRGAFASDQQYQIPTHPPGGAMGGRHAHGYSGPEFIEIIKMIATFGGAAGLGAATIKGVKDIIVKVIDARSKRKLTIKVGGTTLQIQGPARQKDIDSLVERFEDLSKAAKPAKRAET